MADIKIDPKPDKPDKPDKPAVETKVLPRMKSQVVRLAAIKPPPIPQEVAGGGVRFALTCVIDKTFKQADLGCSQEIYRWCVSYKPWLHPQSEWIASQDPASGLIVRVAEAPKPSTMPGFTVENDHKTNSPYVVMSLRPDGAVEVASVPERVPDAVLAEIQDALISADAPLHVGIKLGRFEIVQKNEFPGRTDVYVDHKGQ